MKVSGKKIIALLIVLGLAGSAGFRLAGQASKNADAYRSAAEMMTEGDLDGAYLAFKALGGYKDAEEKMAELVQKDSMLPYRHAAKGDVVLFGTYEQDNDLDNGTEPIEWLVLDKIEEDVLLLSANCLDCRTYNNVPFEPVTWETSAVRQWLNTDFYQDAFSGEEMQRVTEVENQNFDHSLLETEGGEDTLDHVFLLCEKEAGIYMGDELDQGQFGQAAATEYAISQGAKTDEKGMTEWWLRTPGAYEYTAQFIDADGVLYASGAYVDIPDGIRPAIWINTAEKGRS